MRVMRSLDARAHSAPSLAPSRASGEAAAVGGPRAGRSAPNLREVRPGQRLRRVTVRKKPHFGGWRLFRG